MKREWKDATSWSRSHDTEARKVPQTWEFQLPSGRRLVVTRHIHIRPDQWMISIGDGRERITVAGLSADSAKRQAMQWIASWMREDLRAIEEAMEVTL